ncbi:MAG: CNNM domain-containing protein, partial [Thermoanaerobaculia bacterium]|nr:CNNM domain-containing protein [Thermoanaerobaculia bacterium]
LLILFLSEIVPKTLGAVYWRNLAGPTAAFVRGLIRVLYPLIWVSEFLTKLITRGRPVHAFSREEFAALADVGVERGQIGADESRILRNLLRFRDLQVKAVMTPRTVIFALQQDLTIEEALERHPDPSVSRIPIYGTSLDDTRGLVLRIDLMREKLAGRGSLRLRDIERPVQTTIETVSIGRVFERLLSEKLHLMLVLDEYGGLAGLVTLEDVFETMIGIEIIDESDTIEDLQKLAREEWDKRRRRLERERDDL